MAMARDGDTTAVGIAAGTAGRLAADININRYRLRRVVRRSIPFKGPRSDSLAQANFFPTGRAIHPIVGMFQKCQPDMCLGAAFAIRTSDPAGFLP